MLDDVAAVLPGHADARAWARELGVRDGQRFLIGPDGRPDLRANACLASPRWRNLGETTVRDYTYSVAVWLNFLAALGTNWWEASEEDAEEFVFWRVTDPANADRVQTNTFSRDLAALQKFYKWVRSAYGVANPFEGFDAPRIVKSADVKWMDPGGYTRWRDLGLRGLDLSGRVDPWWRGRNEERDVAFCDGLYGNGLRISEWASVVLPELPTYDRRRGYFTGRLADACAKGGYGHPYWTPRSVLKGVLSYLEGSRAAAVRRAQAAGRYERLADRRLVLAAERGSVVLERPGGGTELKRWNDISAKARRRLLRETELGLEPLMLWLNEDGLPRDARGWEHTFDAANRRIRRMGLKNFSCRAHMLRHSFALKWYSIGKLVHAARLGHLSESERADFREQFGDTWHLVQTMLGHRRVETTKDVYLEPFRQLEVEILLAHADGFPVETFMAEVFTGHPRVRTDPLAVPA
ncbi:site-specific integrase [Streptomyces sp. NPDC059851]|uniref:site-specific integrase n=1 Tax=Streptomyces sp. NPDC059851 TaxID=3346971 RepID=UPI00366213CF